MNFRDTHLWMSAFPEGDRGSDVDRLEGAYLSLRDLASTLAAEISADLRQYTVHDITHLDALWGVASELVGTEIPLNPLEGYVLGGAFLLHDAGMSLAAYPDGISEIMQQPLWKQILRQTASAHEKPTDEEIRRCTEEFIRVEHANRARELPMTTWTAPDGTTRQLIEDGTLRQKFGSFIGDIAASHWWSIEKLASQLNHVVPAPPPFPPSWSIDLLKLASILRVADAAHIDERRAPQFLWAVRGSALSKLSADHWLFQSRLTQPERRGDAIYYSSTVSFKETEANAWWLAYDTLQMIDRELRDVDVLLADLRGNSSRFAVRRVANCESPTTLARSIRVTGWVPIDTSIRVGDTVSLVERLGGAALYGRRPLAAVRELIQNGADALRLRNAIQPPVAGSPPISVVIHLDSDNPYVEVTDHGVGMDAENIQNSLLRFGESGWKHDAIFRDYASIVRSLPKTSGKFGIGFFSVFMLGDHVEVVTRRFDKAFSDTLLLKFSHGLSDRPILSPAPQDRILMNGGTTVRVWIRDPESLNFAFKSQPPNDETPGGILTALFPALEFPIDLNYNDRNYKISESDWKTASDNDLAFRTLGKASKQKYIEPFLKNIRSIYSTDGAILGRMAIIPVDDRIFVRRPYIGASVVVNGARSATLRQFVGIVEGEVSRASRDSAVPSPRKEEWIPWLNEQASLLKSNELSGEAQEEASAIICAMGGNPEPLAICETIDGWLSPSSLRSYLQARNQIYIASSYKKKDFTIADNAVFVQSVFPSILQNEDSSMNHIELYSGLGLSSRKNNEQLVLKILSEEWNIDYDMLLEYSGETVHSMYGKYDALYEIGRRPDGIVKDFAHLYKRDLCHDEFESIASFAHESRIRSGHYRQYFGEE